MKLFWDNAESKTSAIPEHKYMMMMIVVMMMMMMILNILLLITMRMAMTMMTTMTMTMMKMVLTYVRVAPCLLLQIAQLRAASTIPPPITRRRAP